MVAQEITDMFSITYTNLHAWLSMFVLGERMYVQMRRWKLGNDSIRGKNLLKSYKFKHADKHGLLFNCPITWHSQVPKHCVNA